TEPSKIRDGLMQASANALLARGFSQSDPGRAAGFSRRALALLGRLANNSQFAPNLLVENPDWESLLTTPDFQALLRLRGVDRRYTGVWLSGRRDIRSRQFRDQSSSRLLEQASQRFREENWPIVIAPVGVGADSEVRFTSIWHAAVPRPELRFHRAS